MGAIGLRLRHAARLFRDLCAYAWIYRAWWLVPVATMLILLGLLVVAGSGTFVLVYTLF